jgi:hypothetical protein
MNHKFANGMRSGKQTGKLPHYYFTRKDLNFYIKKEEDTRKTSVMEHFNTVIFHKSGPANSSIPIYQSINQSYVYVLC